MSQNQPLSYYDRNDPELIMNKIAKYEKDSPERIEILKQDAIKEARAAIVGASEILKADQSNPLKNALSHIFANRMSAANYVATGKLSLKELQVIIQTTYDTVKEWYYHEEPQIDTLEFNRIMNEQYFTRMFPQYGLKGEFTINP